MRPKLSSSHARGASRATKKADFADAERATIATRCGTVAVVGRPNVGKSTLVNALVGFQLSIVTPKPQTTRDRILGVMVRESTSDDDRPLRAQLVFLDTPGLHVARNELGAQMNAHAEEAARQADVVVYVAEANASISEPERETFARVAHAAADAPIVLALNKVDRIKDKTALFAALETWRGLHDFAAFLPISASRGGEGKSEGLDGLLDEIARRLPEGPFLFPEDELTDRPERFLAAELVREQVILQTRDEVPYAVAVTIDGWEEPSNAKAVTRIEATIHVDKEAQRKIVIGAGGDRIKKIGIAARKKIEATLGRRVHLGLFVRVEEGWAHDERKLSDLGYDPPSKA